MEYFVSRQCYWPDGTLMVEIATGGLDYSNPGMLCAQFSVLGEGDIFHDPREAVKAAINIRDAWLKTSPGQDIQISHGFTGGFTMPFSESTDEEMLAWAEKESDKLAKCDQCGTVLGKEKWQHELCFDDEFCSQYCADNNYDQVRRDDEVEDC